MIVLIFHTEFIKFSNSIIENCGDKAISIGEKSNAKILSVNIKNSNYGIASKTPLKYL